MNKSSLISPEVRAFLEKESVGVLATVRPNGRARQSVTYFLFDGDRIVLSTESKRAKARDVERTGWASMCVTGHEKPYPSVTVEGKATVRREGIADDTARIFAFVMGTAPTGLTDETLANMDRVILDIGIEKVYGASYLQGR
jgi:PPOX class probable F420-dependent enzyme